MIPALQPGEPSGSLILDYLAELRLRGFEGDLTHGHADRTVFATDNSIYQLPPQAVLFPKSSTDVVRIARLVAEPRFRDVKLAPRGGGTGTNGQSLTDGVLVDLSRHMNAILEINAEEGWARVQAGVVKDQLNVAVADHGLFFAPELSPSNRATIGGMIATDASGQGSVLYGKTRDHVMELHAVLLDGTQWHSRPLSSAELAIAKGRGDRVGHVLRVIDRIRQEDEALIAERFPKLNRCVTGYDLVHVCDCEGRFDLSAVLCGAEGTLAFVTEAKLRLTPIPKFTALLNIRYASFDAALRDAGALMRLQAASSETIDAKVLAFARQDQVWLKVHHHFPEDAEGPTEGVNIVEFVAETQDLLDAQLSRVQAALAVGDAGRRGYTVARGSEEAAAIWSMRKKAVGLLGNMQGETRPMPFVEDTVVPPENLADYILEFRALLDRRGLIYGMFGHVDAGCLHVRPALDLKDPAQQRLVREISDDVFALTRKYNGVLWGEHGKGLRSEYVPEFFGPLYPRMQEIKAAFDPHNQLNPGKIAAPPGHELTRLDAVPLRGEADRRIPIMVRQANDDALHCNGNAACFNFDPNDAMCPSWKATRDRKQSPKGRASLMREWLRLLGDANLSAASLPQRLMNAWRGGADFSHEVKAAMDGCLACKSCVGQCPVKVDVPSFRARFLEAYYGRYPRPTKDYLVAALETVLPLAVRAPRLVNAIAHNGLTRRATHALGLTALPQIDVTDVHGELRRRGVRLASAAALAALPDAERHKAVIVVQDAFTTHYDATVVLDTFELLQRLGFLPWLAPFMPNGKPQHVLGFLARFRETASRNAEMLRSLSATGVALIGIDPSITLSYRAEYVKLLGAEAVPRVALPQEWLAERLDELPRLAPSGGPAWALLPHCTERTNAPAAMLDWVRVASHLGVGLRVLASGCCGMAGLYGHELANRATSERIYGLSWGAILAEAESAGRTLATGYSCRCQVNLMDGIQLQHPLQLLLRTVVQARGEQTQ
nr:FAD-binding and (Fe-S)-binding domain-containing protein [uncultured Albidiferax sp.]